MSSHSSLKQKIARRLRRKRHVRARVRGTADFPRLTVTRSHKNIQCQAIDDERGVTLASVSTLEGEVRAKVGGFTGNKKAAAIAGKVLAERLKALGIARAKMDRNGYKFHGRIAALVQAAREEGLKI
ncbi:MAG: 50S ribosomal protein L18 [Planctomycetota bacterium]